MKTKIWLPFFIFAGLWLAACQNQAALGSRFSPADAVGASRLVESLPMERPPNTQINRQTAAPPFPTTPPNAGLISVGAPDVEGRATVTGAAGAVPGNAAVAVVNLSAHTIMTDTADASGAFSATLFAPPGSALLVKYETNGSLIDTMWQRAVTSFAGNAADVINVLPGATMVVGAPPTGDGAAQDFAVAGNFSQNYTRGWAGWWLTGTLQAPPGVPPGLTAQPGQTVTITAQIHVTSSAINCTGAPTSTMNAHLGLHSLFDANGRPLPWGMWFDAHLFTPTGLAIEHESIGENRSIGSTAVTGLSCTTPHSFTGSLSIASIVPANLPFGVYLPQLFLEPAPPLGMDEPQVVVWFHDAPIAQLPLLTVGDTVAPRIPWTLFGDYPVNGHRGLQAREDAGQTAMPTRVLFPPHHVVIPRLDARTDAPLTYRLEPQALWLSATDRRLPNPPLIPLSLPSGELFVEILKPDGSVDQIGPAPIAQTSVRTPTTPGGTDIDAGTGHIGELYQLATMDDAFGYQFDQDGRYTIFLYGFVNDIYGREYRLESTYDLTVARILDLDPGQLPTTPYMQDDFFAPGLRLFPPVPADVAIQLVQMPFSDPAQAITTTITGQANRFGYFQPPPGTVIPLEFPGEFRVDYTAVYTEPDGSLWMGTMTWGNVIEGPGAQIAAHGRRGMDYKSDTIDDMPFWFENVNLPPNKVGIENYYPYFSGDIHWGNEDPIQGNAGDSIHAILTLEDLTGASETIYNLMRGYFPRATNCFRWPPTICDLAGFNKRAAINEAPLFITTQSGVDPGVRPDDVDLWGYWYGSSERPDVRVREILSVDNMGTAYWRFNDTYGYQIGESSDGDQPGDIKWEFGGVVLRTITDTNPISEYAIYSSLWVLLPYNDPVGARVTPPFQDATGASVNGGPIMTLLGQDIDMLFLPKGVRPGDVLEVGDTVSFSGHVGPPLDSRVAVTITAPSGAQHTAVWRANKIGWLYDPGFDFPADEPGRWTVDVAVLHDRPYVGNGVTPTSHNTGTVLGTNGQYEFYVVEPDAPRLFVYAPSPGFITWPNSQIEPVQIQGVAPAGTTAVHYTIHDKGIVMSQGSVTPDGNGHFTITYDAKALHNDFPMLSLTAREGLWEGLADEVAINLLAEGDDLRANTVTLIGEEVFIGGAAQQVYLPAILKEN